ncbi:MAG: zeta toxin family protein [Planctomycetota bacterium]
MVVIAGPNGAGKSTFYQSQLKSVGLEFVNADVLAKEYGLDPYDAASAAGVLRHRLVEQRASFIFETVFSDPNKQKLGFLVDCVSAGYNVVLFYIGLADAGLSEQRVAMRVAQGGHDVPCDKLADRMSRSLGNLRSAIKTLPHVFVFDNTDLFQPYRRLAYFRDGLAVNLADLLPDWFRSLYS